MWIIMAFVACVAQISKLPLVFFFMAFSTGCGHVRPFQWESSFVMPCDAEGRAFETFYRMTLVTITNFSVGQQLPFVIVIMAIGTSVVCNRVCIRAGVACLTVQGAVFPFKWITCLAVVEIV
jgi:hypothetical protein